MQGYRILCFFLISFLLVFQSGAISYGDDSPHPGPASLLHKYHEIENVLRKNIGRVFFYVESSVNKNTSRVDIYGTIKYPFAIVQNELLIPPNWCRIVMSHPDIRAWTYKKVNDAWLLNVYDVNKFSEPLEAAYLMKFVYRISKLEPLYFNVALTAQEGASSTKDHQFRFEAIKLKKNTTFIHLRYFFSYSSLEYFLAKIFGSTRIGFSIIGSDSAGNPVYVEDIRGSVERDIACHYLAILAYFDTLGAHSDQQFERRVSQWYDLTVPFKKQLFEMKKDEYLKYKSRDWENQQRLQGDLNR